MIPGYINIDKEPYTPTRTVSKKEARNLNKLHMNLGFKKKKKCNGCDKRLCVCNRIAENEQPVPTCWTCGEPAKKCICVTTVKPHYSSKL